MSLDVDIRARNGGFTLTAALSARPGEILAIIGPNGAGKSTLLGAIAGHLRDVEGTISLDGRVLHGDGVRLTPQRRRIGLLGQRALLFPHLSTLENVAFGPRAQGVPRGAARERAQRLLAEVGLTEHDARRPAQLSGGQQQRVALARALAADPQALLLDEPFAALDAQTAAQARRLIAEQRDRAGIPLVLVTHDPLDAVVLADRMIVLQDGGIVQQGSTGEVLGHPRSAFLAAMSGVNLVEGAPVDGTVVVSDANGATLRLRGPAPVTDAARASAVFAPGAVRIRGAADDTAPTAENRWHGTISYLEPVPGAVRLHLEEYPILVDCPSATAATADLRAGARMAFEVAVEDVSARSFDA
ncbi:ATP-binding cassette domain-containing protein [Microbacterium pseudoresistens]|uniref:Molybdate transport system ATP-binding protein n=1 Tax=Microbacterium pseudoresistens TaxID=640634 RepID=A0A7Y9EVF3_9MICO|nr:ATP-binding cassette domain-containing protein [Microbacterium pseudoresistens]NYD54692.1 molybdate transport system ATP-binding protein [Microbacterium pseudoresistens]